MLHYLAYQSVIGVTSLVLRSARHTDRAKESTVPCSAGMHTPDNVHIINVHITTCHSHPSSSPLQVTVVGSIAQDMTCVLIIARTRRYDHPTEGPALRALAAKQRPVQEASTGLYPALYAVPSCKAGTT